VVTARKKAFFNYNLIPRFSFHTPANVEDRFLSKVKPLTPETTVQIVSLLASGYISSRFPNMRCAVMLIGNLICVAAGSALVGLPSGPDGTDNKWGRLVALWLCSFQSVGFSMSLTSTQFSALIPPYSGYVSEQRAPFWARVIS
jgi:hypothetical protein